MKEELSNLSVDNKKEIIKLLSSLLTTKENKENVQHCPYCDSNNFVRYGRQNGVQRYRCICGKTFCEKFLSLNYYSQVNDDLWVKFIDYEISGLTLKEISYYTGLSVTPCFR